MRLISNHTLLCSTLLGLTLLLTACGKTGLAEEDPDNSLREATNERLTHCCNAEGEPFDLKLGDFIVGAVGTKPDLSVGGRELCTASGEEIPNYCVRAE